MDPVTAALVLANTVAQIVLTNMELMKAMPLDKQAEYGELQLKNLQEWKAFVDSVIRIFHPK